MNNILTSKLIFQLSVGCSVFIPLFLIAKIYLTIKTSDWSMSNITYISLSFLALVSIFSFVFSERQRLGIAVFEGGVIIILGVLLAINAIVRK